jgi:hypothetical protein
MFRMGFTLEVDHLVGDRLGEIVRQLNDRAENIFLNEDYGSEIYEVIIGLICVEPSLQSLGFLVPRKARFRKSITTKLIAGGTVTSERVLTWDVNLDRAEVLTTDTHAMQNYVVDSVLKNLAHLNKYRGFDRIKFEADLQKLKET